MEDAILPSLTPGAAFLTDQEHGASVPALVPNSREDKAPGWCPFLHIAVDSEGVPLSFSGFTEVQSEDSYGLSQEVSGMRGFSMIT